MNKLIKAEWYRLTHSGSYFKFLMFTCIASSLLNLLMEVELLEKPLFDNIVAMGQIFSMFMPMLIGTTIAAALSNAFQNRTTFYEVMDGSSISAIIGSKLVVYGATVCVIFGAAAGSYFSYIGFANGLGETKEPVIFALLFFIISLRIVLSSVLTTLWARKMVVAVCIPYVRYEMLEGFLPIILMECFPSSEKLADVLSIFPVVQFGNLATPTYETDFIVMVVVSALVELTALFIIVYMGYKKKKFR